MVQQQQQPPPPPPTANGQAMQPQVELESSSLAMPAMAANQPAQYSPHTALYQQQLIKGAKQFVSQQQQQKQAATNGRLNGINGTNGSLHHSPQQQQHFGSQQNSPQQQQQQQLNHQFQQAHLNEALYTNSQQPPARPAPIYQPKPTFYAHLAPQQAQQQQQQQQASQMYQTARPQPHQQLPMGAAYFQAQHSPSSLILAPRAQQQTAAGLHVQQVAGTSQQAVNMSPLQQQHQLEQQQRQMQQLVISYQQQEQLQLQLQLQQQQEQQQQQHQNAYLTSQAQVQMQSQVGQLTAATSWPTTNAIQQEDSSQLQQQHHLNSQVELLRHQQQQQQQQRQLQASRLYLRPASGAPSRFSDRDSVSTLSRFNQLDDRRSFTMRSQYTQQAARHKAGKQFTFLQLTGEALRSLLGVTSSGARGEPLLATGRADGITSGGQTDQLGRNLSLGASGQSAKGPQLAGVTVIDSGEQLHFKRQVVRYQLAISRLLHFLLSAFVLLSPVVMLLLPKTESLFNGQHEQIEFGEAHSEMGHSAGLNGVTHAVGLVGKEVGVGGSKQLPQQQPQWRISECASSDCDGPLIGFVARLILLALAHWALFFRAQTATLPRLDVQRCLLVSLALLLTMAYWLFFLFRVFDKRHQDFELHYLTIVQFATSMLETLLVLHYVALVLLEMRHRKKSFCLKVVRSPDGASKFYSCGSLSIQKCAQMVLEKYHRDFVAFDGRAERLLELEDELAHELERQRTQRQQQQQDSSSSAQPRGRSSSRRSRAGSPRRRDDTHHQPDEDDADEANDERTETNDGDESAAGRRASGRHHHHRRRRRHERSRRESNDEDEHDEREEERKRHRTQSPSGRKKAAANSSSSKRPEDPKERDEEDSDHGCEQSSDGETSRVKESSLETIRAANVDSSEQQLRDIEVSERARNSRAARALEARDELESVRSARSRRSTSSRINRSRSGAAERERKRSRDHRERSASRSRSQAGDPAVPQASRASQQPVGGSSADRRDTLDEHERKLRRRGLRLLAAVEHSFERVRRLEEEAAKQQKSEQADCSAPINMRPGNAAGAMDASQAARALYPQIARSLQKYLRLTKQTGRHNLQSIHEHLGKCLLYKLSARAFLEKFTNFDQVWQQSETHLFANCRSATGARGANGALAPPSGHKLDQLELNSWSLVCDTLLSRQIKSGTFFVLKQAQVSLLVTVAKLPHLNLSEQVSDQNNCAFSLAPNPEASLV